MLVGLQQNSKKCKAMTLLMLTTLDNDGPSPIGYYAPNVALQLLSGLSFYICFVLSTVMSVYMSCNEVPSQLFMAEKLCHFYWTVLL